MEGFETKISRTKECRTIIERARAHGNKVSDEDAVFLKWLLENHKEKATKIGCGIASFGVEKTLWGNYGFFLTRVDGTRTDFSFVECVTPRSHLQEVKMACRTAIRCDVKNLKQAGNIAHHEGKTFDQIFNEWVAGKDIATLAVNPTRDNDVETYFIDSGVAQDFRDFHNKLAVIKNVTFEEHKIIHGGSR